MAIRNLKDGSTKPWICECYPTGRTGKRVRKRFATKGEAAAYETFIMREVDDKPWLAISQITVGYRISLIYGIHTMDGHW